MQFFSMSALPEAVPSTEILRDSTTFDLHNDGELREVCYDYKARELRMSWTMHEPAWKTPDHPGLEERTVIGTAVVVVSGVRRLRSVDDLVTPVDRDSGGLEFIEYRRLAPGVGELRFVMANEAELIVTGSRCELRIVGR